MKTFPEASCAFRNNGGKLDELRPDYEFVYWEYLKNSIRLGSAAEKFELKAPEGLPEKEKEIYLLQLKAREILTLQSPAACMRFCEKQQIVQKARDFPGLNQFWLVEALSIFSYSSLLLRNNYQTIHLCQEQYDLALKEGFINKASESFANLTYAYLDLKDYHNVELCLERSSFFLKMHHLHQQPYYAVKAKYLMTKSQFDKALKFLQLSEDLLKGKESYDNFAFGLFQKAKCYLAMGKFHQLGLVLEKITHLHLQRGGGVYKKLSYTLKMQYYIQTMQLNQAQTFLPELDELSFESVYEESIFPFLIFYDVLSNSNEIKLTSVLNQKHKKWQGNNLYEVFNLLYKVKYNCNSQTISEIKKKYSELIVMGFNYELTQLFFVEFAYYIQNNQLKKAETIIYSAIDWAHSHAFYWSEYFYLNVIRELPNSQITDQHKRREAELASQYKMSLNNLRSYWPFSLLVDNLENKTVEYRKQKELILIGENEYPFPQKGKLNQLMHVLVSTPNFVVESEKIVQILWGLNYIPYRHDQKVYQLIAQLRDYFTKNGLDPSLIENIPGEGYRLKTTISKELAAVVVLNVDDYVKSLPENSLIYAKEISELLQQPLRTVQRKLKELTNQGVLCAVGARKSRHYIKLLGLKRSA